MNWTRQPSDLPFTTHPGNERKTEPTHRLMSQEVVVPHREKTIPRSSSMATQPRPPPHPLKKAHPPYDVAGGDGTESCEDDLQIFLGGHRVELADEKHVGGGLGLRLGQVPNHLQHHRAVVGLLLPAEEDRKKWVRWAGVGEGAGVTNHIQHHTGELLCTPSCQPWRS